jgi:hypothetical protein
MPQRLGITTGQLRAATTALGGIDNLNVVAVTTAQQRSLVLGVTRLPAAPLLRLRFGPGGLGVRMLRARRQRGVLRRAIHARLQLCYLGQQQANNRLCLRQLPRDQFFRDFQRHAQGVANFRRYAKTRFSLRPVNDYRE